MFLNSTESERHGEKERWRSKEVGKKERDKEMEEQERRGESRRESKAYKAKGKEGRQRDGPQWKDPGGGSRRHLQAAPNPASTLLAGIAKKWELGRKKKQRPAKSPGNLGDESGEMGAGRGPTGGWEGEGEGRGGGRRAGDRQQVPFWGRRWGPGRGAKECDATQMSYGRGTKDSGNKPKED